jgi:hypothetical protein
MHPLPLKVERCVILLRPMLLRPLLVSFLAVLVWTCLFSGLAPVAATVVAAAHPGPAGAILRRRDVVRIVGDVALTVDYYLTGCASCVSRLGDGGGCADDCEYRKPCANREE